jgi:hypothetical protein
MVIHPMPRPDADDHLETVEIIFVAHVLGFEKTETY